MQIRLARIDAPQLEQKHGKRARRFLAFICPVGMEVRLQTHGQDRRKRMLATVTCNDINANVAMVMGGHAWASERYAGSDDLYRIQERARKNRRGLWRYPDPVAPWEFRRVSQ